MSIRIKLLLGSLSLTAVTVLLGLFAQNTQRDMGGVATRIYDQTVLAVSYLRSVQGTLARAETQWHRNARPGSDADPDRRLALVVADVQEDLGVAYERAMSAAGRQAVGKVQEDLRTIEGLRREAGALKAFEAMDQIQTDLEVAVEVYAADGFRYRRSVGEMVESSDRRLKLAIGLSIAVGLAITGLLSRSIVPALGKAVDIAQAIAAGRLDNHIRWRGRSETAKLLRALAAMQDSIRVGMARIQALMDQQVRSHASEIALQHAQFEAALENMSQGLCLFDRDGRLTVVNRRFAEMFGMPERGSTLEQVLRGAGLAMPGRLDTSQPATSFSCRHPDGRDISVAQRSMAGDGWVMTYEDVTERRAAELNLVRLARHDALTGLPNRLLLSEHMETALDRSGPDRGTAVLCIDLDRFKAVNDTLGHAAGDTILQVAAGRMRDVATSSDLIARVGGDEFVMIQERGDARALARRLIDALSLPFQVDQQKVSIGASIGIALLDQHPGSNEDLLKFADLALYRAKANGRGTFCFFEAEMDVEIQQQRALELDLRQALSGGQFAVHYQPLIATSGGINGFEALIRWNHPSRGMISPAVFIPLAEEIGLIDTIGAWVLRQACSDAAHWPEPLKLAVNLSSVQFRNGTLTAHVADALLSSGFSARRLELEITESVLLDDEDTALETLHGLRGLGARISMDDFGTGYSSLSYLRRFPFDKLKIDQSFVRGMTARDDCRAIVRAVIGLGRSLDIKVNAEGVETPEQLAALRTEGCGEVQGYLFSPPKPVGEIAGLLRHHGIAGPGQLPRRPESEAA